MKDAYIRRGSRTRAKVPVLLEMRVEPSQGAGDDVALVLGIGEEVAFALVDYELGFDAEGLECVPEFVGLRGGDFAIAVPDQDKRGSFGFLDEIDRRTFGVNFGVVLDGLAKERNNT